MPKMGTPEEIARRSRVAMSHGMSKSPEYMVWINMKTRCTKEYARDYYLYGGRGIKFCERWKKFENFIEDMGPRPSSKHSLDRIDNNGHYEPSNCRWATAHEQLVNRRGTKFVTYKGVSRAVGTWAKMYNIDRSVLRHRLRAGLDMETALTKPLAPNGGRFKKREPGTD